MAKDNEPVPPMVEYKAKAIVSAISLADSREVVFGLRGEPGPEEYLAVRLPAGAVGPLILALRLALEDLDKKVGDETILAQPLHITGAEPAEPASNLPAIFLTLDGLNLTAIMPSIEKAREVAAAFSDAADAAAHQRPRAPRH